MPGSYAVGNGRIHALTMIAYHRDARRTGMALVIFFGIVFGFDGTMWLATGSGPFAFGSLTGLAVMLLGAWLHTHHGKKLARWQAALARIESSRRDSTIHVRPAR